jgi:hypothetical protein
MPFSAGQVMLPTRERHLSKEGGGGEDSQAADRVAHATRLALAPSLTFVPVAPAVSKSKANKKTIAINIKDTLKD